MFQPTTEYKKTTNGTYLSEIHYPNTNCITTGKGVQNLH